jgi:hypothetical protein
VDDIVAAITRQARERADRDGTQVEIGLVERGPR